jgi:hypothetical protein
MKVALLCMGLLACSSSSGAPPLQDNIDGSLLPHFDAGVHEAAGGGADGGTGDDSASDSTVASPGDSSSDVVAEVAPPVTGCNGIVPAGPQVSETVADGSAPSAVGGSIALGTYFLTEIDLYGPPPTGLVVQRTLVVDATRMNFAEVLGSSPSDGGDPADDSTWTYTIADAVLGMAEYCPTNGASQNVFFSAQGNTLTLLVSTSKAEIYTLQPSSDP